MKKLILKLADDINSSRINGTEAENIVKSYIGNIDPLRIPEWLSEEDIDIAVAYYNCGNKLLAVKHIYEFAKPYTEYALKWSKEFLENYVGK